jgi:hypothetical protein
LKKHLQNSENKFSSIDKGRKSKIMHLKSNREPRYDTLGNNFDKIRNDDCGIDNNFIHLTVDNGNKTMSFVSDQKSYFNSFDSRPNSVNQCFQLEESVTFKPPKVLREPIHLSRLHQDCQRALQRSILKEKDPNIPDFSTRSSQLSTPKILSSAFTSKPIFDAFSQRKFSESSAKSMNTRYSKSSSGENVDKTQDSRETTGENEFKVFSRGYSTIKYDVRKDSVIENFVYPSLKPRTRESLSRLRANTEIEEKVKK